MLNKWCNVIDMVCFFDLYVKAVFPTARHINEIHICTSCHVNVLPTHGFTACQVQDVKFTSILKSQEDW